LQKPGKQGICSPWMFRDSSGDAPKARSKRGHGRGHLSFDAPFGAMAMPPNDAHSRRDKGLQARR